MNLKPAPQDAASWLPDVLEVMDRNNHLLSHLRVIKTEPYEHRERWSEEDDLRLLTLRDSGLTTWRIAQTMGRSVLSVGWRTRQLRKEGAL